MEFRNLKHVCVLELSFEVQNKTKALMINCGSNASPASVEHKMKKKICVKFFVQKSAINTCSNTNKKYLGKTKCYLQIGYEYFLYGSVVYTIITKIYIH